MTVEVAKEVIASSLRDVERIAGEDFERNGYRVVQVRSVEDLGYRVEANGVGRRLWRVTAACERIDGRRS